jgi:hypothetical protein
MWLKKGYSQSCSGIILTLLSKIGRINLNITRRIGYPLSRPHGALLLPPQESLEEPQDVVGYHPERTAPKKWIETICF